MTVSRPDFAEFFAFMNGGQQPYAWQERLLDHLFTTGRWPDTIGAPTGAGKSNVVDVHVFANALFAAGSGPRVPRRLATVVGRRALVDNQADRAARIRERLLLDEPIATAVRKALVSLVTGAADPEFLLVAELRGGLPPNSTWLDDPRVCAVISATPDMWGSRLLLRGYGSSTAARPREGGFLAFDSAIVLDEAHLNQQLLLTARTLSTWMSEGPETGVPSLQVVETTATPASGSAQSVGVTAEDLAAESALASRLLNPKPFTLVESPTFPAKSRADRRHCDLLITQIQHLRDVYPGETIGCIVNRVDTAIQVHSQLRRWGINSECWVGRRRPLDLAGLREKHHTLFDPTLAPSDQPLQVLVATQTIEVGVDIDLAALVTELAPGSAVAQRAGRVNRRGLRPRGSLVVVTPPHPIVGDYPPYSEDDVAGAYDWLERLREQSITLSPWSVSQNPPPPETPRRGMLKHPELHDAMRWAVTSTPMLAEEDLELWLRDSLDSEDQPVGVVLRGPLPPDDASALALLIATPPSSDEVFPTSLAVARSVVQRVQSGAAGPDRRVFRLREGALEPLEPDGVSVRPGDLFLLPGTATVTRAGVVVPDPPDSPEHPRTVWGEEETDVIFPGDPHDEWLTEFVGLNAEGAQEVISERLPGTQMTLPPDTLVEDALPWLVLKPRTATNSQEEDRQAWSIHPGVRLDSHSEAVRDRAAQFSRDLGLAKSLAGAVTEAAFRHDAGKLDRRFQIRLGGDSRAPLAKSVFSSAQEARRAWAKSGLDSGWRHEHRSACHAWLELASQPHGDLIVRLVGASHGRGRGVPGDHGRSLVTEADGVPLKDAARALFDEGEWVAILDRTDSRYGVWACTYLEAILRAADCQVSKEGS